MAYCQIKTYQKSILIRGLLAKLINILLLIFIP